MRDADWATDDGRLRLYCGDAVDVLRDLPAGSVHCCVTSPPYWGLRSYLPKDHPDKAREIGSESTIDAHMAALVGVFREVKRVLRPDGLLAVNYGDAYAQTGRSHTRDGGSTGITRPSFAQFNSERPERTCPDGVAPGNLLGLPWRFAFAMQADGWILRSAVVWAKGASFNPNWNGSVMPESVSGTRWERCRVKVAKQNPLVHARDAESGRTCATGRNMDDMTKLGMLTQWSPCPGCPKCAATGGYVLRRGSGRPVSAYEMVFLFAKKPGYYYDAEAVREVRYKGVHGETLLGLQSDLAADGVLSEPNDEGRIHEPLQEVCQGGAQAIRQDAEGSGQDTPVATGREVEGVQKSLFHKPGEQSVSGEICEIGKGQGGAATISPKCPRQENDGCGLSKAHRSGPRESTSKVAAIEQEAGEQGRAETIFPNRARQGTQAGQRQGLQGQSKGARSGEPLQYETQKTQDKRPMRRDGETVDSDENSGEGPMLLLPREEDLDNGPRNSAFCGRRTHHQQHRAGVPVVQQQEGRQAPPSRIVSSHTLRNVWAIGTSAYREAHFATFPPALVEPIIKAATSEAGVCPACGAGWARVIEHERRSITGRLCPKHLQGSTSGLAQPGWRKAENPEAQSRTLGWRPTCACQPGWAEGVRALMDSWPQARSARKRRQRAAWGDWERRAFRRADGVVMPARWERFARVPAVVLDPFAGAGTVALVAEQLGRASVGIELNPEYVAQIKKRVGKEVAKTALFDNGRRYAKP